MALSTDTCSPLLDNFAERFGAFAGEAQAIKAAIESDVRIKLSEADALLAQLEEVGIPFRIELPMAVGTRLTDLRIKAGFRLDLK